ncbi:phage tail tube protein [Rhodobacter capsulatus]|uniref:phage tail tube protein n=1 Tax=Rhodobacter capsulatus TaxID=1061 RepID=UPI00402A540C
MAQSFDIGIGSTVSIGVGATPVWTTLTGVGEITLPEIEVDDIEVTNMDSSGRQKEYIAGLSDGGDVSLDIQWEPGNATDVLLLSIYETRETVQIKFTVPKIAGGTAYTTVWRGYLKSYKRVAPVDEVKKATVTFKISSKVS